ncbi:MAG TPA: MFS transporter [Thermoanaerobaculia bacterium]|jgi:MFS family permease|nr:MFS transporter [Thermoanaerobaculia bacterium]
MNEERYPRYVLGVLVVVYVFNFIDRQILSILAERIKSDLGVTDAQMGYLYGTAFAVFFAIFGIPLGRLADVWDRRRLIAWGLAAWSAMTALSGMAGSFAQLALARFGVGVGEASASPAAYSLLSDYFPARRRATALGVYSSGIYIGAGLGLGIGGLIVNRWDAAWAGTAPPLGLHGWQVAFMVVGLPGLLLSLWVRSLREPVRGQADGVATTAEARPWREFFRELAAVLPPFTLVNLWLRGGRWRTLSANLLTAALCVAGAAALTRWLDNPAQWYSLGIGLYAAVSWGQGLRLRDPACFALVLRTPSLNIANLSIALLAFTSYSYGFWIAPYMIRAHGESLARAGLILGGISAACGWLGVTLGGILADRFLRRSPTGRLRVTMLAAVLAIPFAILFLRASNPKLAYVASVPLLIVSSLWLGPGASTVQELVLPRMRAVASAAYLLVVTFIGLALGPYTVGRLSVALGDLRPALLWALLANVLSLACALYAARRLPRDEESRWERAHAAGEPR